MLLIKTDRDNLLKPLQMVTGIVEKKQTMPILANVIIESQDNLLTFLTSDKEMQITARTGLNDENHKNFSLTVSAKKFQDILRALDNDTEVSLFREEDRLLVKSSRNRFNLHILPSDDFPRMIEDNTCLTEITVQQRVLKRLLNDVQYAIADQDLRYYLNGVLLAINAGEIKTVGTDTHRLALATAPSHIDENAAHEAILPRKTVQELLKLLKDDDEENNVRIEFFPKRVKFSFSDIIFVSRVIDGNYINYSRAIPSRNEKHLILDRVAFLQALQRVAILSNSNELYRGVRLVIDKGNLCVISRNIEQEEAVAEMPVDYENESIDICLKIQHLLDLLNHVAAESFLFSLASASDSVLVTIPGRDDFCYVIMPIKI
ncbi:MAG: DNA polymerase III subunit beta [Nitrosomonas sp.]|jgi:DNA polymerase-3 subunit beta|nr:DNA polymerase III subunit beta [Nitrosomonas sp.]